MYSPGDQSQDSSWQVWVPGSICILILYSKTTSWGAQARKIGQVVKGNDP